MRYFALFALLTASASQASVLSVNPAAVNINQGGSVSLSLDIELIDAVQGGRTIISYDPSALDFDEITGFNFGAGPWNDGGGLDVANAVIDEVAGTIDVQVSAGFDTFSGIRNIASFDFFALLPGLTSILLSYDGVPESSQWGVFGEPIELAFEGAMVDVQAVPLPAVAWLFPAGLIAGLGWMRRGQQRTAG